MQIKSIYEEGFRFFHDPSLHYPITADNSVRVDPATGECVLYLGMTDYLKEGERMRKTITFVSGPPVLLLQPEDKNGQREWDGVVGISWDRKGVYGYYNQNCISDPESISDHYSPETAVTNDGTTVRTSFIFAYDSNVKYLIKREGAANRTVSAYNVTSVVLNQNEYICSVISTSGDKFLKQLSSGTENAIKLTIRYDLAYDFTDDERGVNIFTMSDTIAQIQETKLT